jgi:hypothetical protein
MMEESRLKSRAERMVENYASRLRVGQCGTPARVGDLKSQAERFAAGVARMRAIDAATTKVTDAEGVATIMRPFYCSFARKLGKLVARAWGDNARRDEGRVLVDVWVARGLCREVLLRIAREVFELELAEGKSE